MSLLHKRPKGITIFAIIAALDAVASIIFIIFLATASETMIMIMNDPVSEITADYRLLGEVFSENLIIGFTLVIILDTLMVIGLLSSKSWSRKLVLGCASLGIIFNMTIINFPGLVFNVILLGYMLKTSIREYYLTKV